MATKLCNGVVDSCNVPGAWHFECRCLHRAVVCSRAPLLMFGVSHGTVSSSRGLEVASLRQGPHTNSQFAVDCPVLLISQTGR